MKRYFYQIFIFFIPLFLLIIYLLWNNIPSNFKYKHIKNDCSDRGSWIYNRIYTNETPIDIAFIGSSKTIHAIQDSIIESNLNYGNIVNLGYCRYGRDLSFWLIKELINNKKPKAIFIEIRANENFSSHPIFPYLANKKEIFSQPIILNQKYISNIFKYGTEHYEYFLSKLLNKNEDSISTDKTIHGYWNYSNSLSSQDAKLIKLKNLKPKRTTLFENLNLNFPHYYLKEIQSLANKNNVKIFFYYLPSYDNFTLPRDTLLYKEIGKLLIPPSNIVENKRNWFDENHMNESGSMLYSNWIINETKKEGFFNPSQTK